MRIPKSVYRAAAVATLAGILSGTGCLLTSGQVLISFDLTNPITVPTVATAIRVPVDLNTIGDYNDHKKNLADLADLALVGDVTNGNTATNIEFWMTPGATSLANAAAVRSDPTAIQLWGPLALAAGETHRIDWDGSAALFKGRQALLDQIKTDGVFTLYALASSTALAANFTINNGVLILVLDAGI
jgi:hypothetical protein